MAHGDETQFVESLRAGEPGAIEKCVRTHQPWMRALAGRLLNDGALADDCVQEAFLKALSRIDRFEQRSSLKTWLHRITVNEALMKLRSRKRAKEESIDPLLPDFDRNGCRVEAPWTTLVTPEEVLERDDLRTLVRSKIEELPESYRIVLVLRDIEELDTNETAEVLGISIANAKVRLHRARAALKRLLEPILRGEAT